MSTTSSPPPSPHRHVHHLHRSHSPIPHIATILPTHHHTSMYAPGTRAADISRLLDPAYASGSSSSSASTASPTRHKHTQTRAYVDRHGDLHDPDYRDFPVLPTTSRTASGSRRRRTSHGARSRSTSRHADRQYSTAYSIARPEWERDWPTEAGEDDDEDVFDDDTESQSHYSPFASHAATRRSSTVHSTPAYRPYVPVPYTDYTSDPQPFSSSPVDSLDDHSPSMLQESPLHDTPFLGDYLEGESEERRKKKSRRSSGSSAILGRKSSKKTGSQAKEVSVDGGSEKSDSEHAAQQFSVDGERADEVPSCSDALRQQWARLALRVKFSVFRARRRLRSRSNAQSDTSRFPT
ncbi:uncharacterized protein B0H18DRAFT_1123618 [Fomitopsis serialis]|uniref:uncharacterized protein n=1 Tax=Fomitopsis serialis TaxID=139415 RepID=UPI002007BD1D|nr:uncharacterized protein B0H18DRAFT_1123618 [Neoantrodia serialis]KAH9917431.1 hypothetical protein B0H18DRAFT_1123618 [Neoantrodia serialis]